MICDKCKSGCKVDSHCIEYQVYLQARAEAVDDFLRELFIMKNPSDWSAIQQIAENLKSIQPSGPKHECKSCSYCFQSNVTTGQGYCLFDTGRGSVNLTYGCNDFQSF